MDYQNNFDDVRNDDTLEGFNTLNKDIALRALLFAMVFYIVSSPVIVNAIESRLPHNLETVLVQAILFGITFYLISTNL